MEARWSESPKLMPIRTVSPSRFEGFRQCALREVWGAAREPEWLPLSPATWLGRVCHALLEEAGKHAFTPGDSAAIETRWRELVCEAEERMDSLPLDRFMSPLESRVGDFYVRKIKTVAHALKLAEQPTSTRTKGPGSFAYGRELWLEARGGMVRGCIDAVVPSPKGPIIQDFKSGEVFEATEEGRKLKVDYQAQLKLYAALYFEVHGIWPSTLEIIPIGNAGIKVDFSPEECLRVLSQAVQVFVEVNFAIKCQLPEDLANPSPPNCRRCGYRPACMAYRNLRKRQPMISGLPADVFGRLSEVKIVGNGSLLVLIDTGASVLSVRGLDVKIHPRLAAASAGTDIAAFSLQKTSSATVFSAKAGTVFYF